DRWHVAPGLRRAIGQYVGRARFERREAVSQRVIPDIVAAGVLVAVRIADKPAWRGAHVADLRLEIGFRVDLGVRSVAASPHAAPRLSGVRVLAVVGALRAIRRGCRRGRRWLGSHGRYE